MLIGEKVILEEIDPSNIEWMRQQRNDPEMRQYFREWKDITKDQQAKWYASRGNNSDSNHVYFQIMEAGNDCSDKRYAKNKLIGCCGLHYVDWRLRAAEFGIFISKDARGKGLGKEALTMLCDFGFKEMNLHKIWCEVYDNNASINLYRKLGFRDDGKLRHSYFSNGVYGDSIMMSLLEDEWE